MQGSCGYGDLSKTAYPFWSVAALATQNQFYLAGPANGCGECFEIQCLNSGGQYAVSSALHHRPVWYPGRLTAGNKASFEHGLLACMFVMVLCLQGRCNSDPSQQSTTVMISDECPECEANQFDMQALTFNKVSLVMSCCSTTLLCCYAACYIQCRAKSQTKQ